MSTGKKERTKDMIKNKLYTADEFAELNFCRKQYMFNEDIGTFSAKLFIKAWARKRLIRLYLDFDDGRKIFCAIPPRHNFLGVKNIESGSHILITYGKNADGDIRPIKIEI